MTDETTAPDSAVTEPPAGGQEKKPARKRARREVAAPAQGTGAATPDVDTDTEPEMVPVGVAWWRALRDIGVIRKDSRNTDQGFVFRGIDATMTKAHEVFIRHGLIVLPAAVEVLESERYETRSKAKMHGLLTRHDWVIIGPAGDTMQMQTLGQAADSGDKVATKAASVAYRTALLQGLTVPTGDPDPDATSHERATDEQVQRGADARQPLWDRILEVAAAEGYDAPRIAAHYLEKMGHAIDSADSTVETLADYLDRLVANFDAQRAAKTAEGTQEPAEQPAAAEEQPEPVTAPEQAEEPAAAPSETRAAAAEQQAAHDAATDPRQSRWDKILAAGRALSWPADRIRADFTAWAQDAHGIGRPLEIDGPDTDVDILDRYAWAIANGHRSAD